MKDRKLKKTLARMRRACAENPEFRKKVASEIQAAAREASIDDDYMSWEALRKTIDRAPQILELLRECGEDLDDWQETKIQLAAEYLDAVYDSLYYRR